MLRPSCGLVRMALHCLSLSKTTELWTVGCMLISSAAFEHKQVRQGCRYLYVIGDSRWCAAQIPDTKACGCPEVCEARVAQR